MCDEYDEGYIGKKQYVPRPGPVPVDTGDDEIEEHVIKPTPPPKPYKPTKKTVLKRLDEIEEKIDQLDLKFSLVLDAVLKKL